MGFRSYIREFLVAILMLFRPSLPWCFPIRGLSFEQKEKQEQEQQQLGPLPAGPVRPLGPCCLGVAEAPFLSLES